jgi:hypothetical protein
MISHYTGVDALEAILKSKRIRFTRLDRFDDVHEAQAACGIDFGSQLFASCWVRGLEEQIPQWSMYGRQMMGIRISIPANPFDWRLINGIYQLRGCQAKYEFNQARLPFTFDEILGDGYLIVPDAQLLGEFLQDVIYVSDVAEAYARHVVRTNGAWVIRPGPSYLARYKFRAWEFQRECRFILSTKAAPRRVLSDEEYGDAYMKLVRDPNWATYPVDRGAIDLPLGQHAFDSMIVTMGPLSSEKTREQVESLVNEYAPHAEIRESDLKGSIRDRE